MCGIVGIIGSEALYRCVSVSLAQIDRGKKGSGYAWINPDKKMWFVKAPVHPLQLAVVEHFFTDNKAKMALGHNRMPSKGNVSYENCHPFFDCENRFALVHNGTILFTENQIEKIKKDHKIFGETDSELLTHVICSKLNKGLTIKKALEELIKETQTQTTLVLLDKNGDLYATKDLMDLWLCQVKNSAKGDFSILASEREAIELALLDVTVNKTRKQTIEYKELDSGDLIHIDMKHKVTISKHEMIHRWDRQAWGYGLYSYNKKEFVDCWEYDPITQSWTKHKRKVVKSLNYGDW